MTVNAKVCFKDSIKVVPIEDAGNPGSFQAFQSAVIQHFQLQKNTELSAVWIDDEGEMVTVTSDEELAEAIRVMGVHNKETWFLLRSHESIPEAIPAREIHEETSSDTNKSGAYYPPYHCPNMPSYEPPHGPPRDHHHPHGPPYEPPRDHHHPHGPPHGPPRDHHHPHGPPHGPPRDHHHPHGPPHGPPRDHHHPHGPPHGPPRDHHHPHGPPKKEDWYEKFHRGFLGHQGGPSHGGHHGPRGRGPSHGFGGPRHHCCCHRGLPPHDDQRGHRGPPPHGGHRRGPSRGGRHGSPKDPWSMDGWKHWMWGPKERDEIAAY